MSDRAGQSAASGLILAGGEGRRLRPLTQRIAGDGRPKQFCPVLGTTPLLGETRRRVARVLPPDRTLVVVTRRTGPDARVAPR